MNAIIAQNQDALADICRGFHVARLEVFGSGATDAFDERRSDLDFIVEFRDVPRGKRFDTFFGLQGALRELFARPIDLVEEGAPRNPYFIRRLNESRKLVYAS